MIHNTGQEDHFCVTKPDELDRSFDVVRVKYIKLDNVNLQYSKVRI